MRDLVFRLKVTWPKGFRASNLLKSCLAGVLSSVASNLPDGSLRHGRSSALGVSGFGDVTVKGFRVQGFRVEFRGLGFRVWDLGRTLGM